MKLAGLIIAVGLLTASCAPAVKPCEPWSAWCGCYCGPGRTWSGTGPEPTAAQKQDAMDAYWETKYPTKIAIADGRILHPERGTPVDCELMAPFESRVPEIGKPGAAFRHIGWFDSTLIEIVGFGHYIIGGSYNAGVIRQGIAMSRACRALGEAK